MQVDTDEFRSGSQSWLEELRFCFPLRRYQEEIVELCKLKLERGEKELHIVAPPGAGKTIIGLQIISQFRCPTLVLCPNTTIQAQWSQKLKLFLPPDLVTIAHAELLGTHEDRPLKPITVLTYQVLSTVGREQEYLEELAQREWVGELSGSMSLSKGQAELRILELLMNNPQGHSKELSRHVRRLRRRLTEVLDLEAVLHDNALDLIQALRRQKFRLIIFDECHHLTDYWAAVMLHLVRRLDDVTVVGLTGTPPEGKTSTQTNRYLTLVGDIDYQVPTPALIKEGGLAPFQDLVYLTEPLDKEREFLQEQHTDFHALLEELIRPQACATASADPLGRRDETCTAASMLPGATLAPGTLAAISQDRSINPTGLSCGKEEEDRLYLPEGPSAGHLTHGNGTYPSQLSLWILKRMSSAAPSVETMPKQASAASAREVGLGAIANAQPELAVAMARYLWTNRLPMPPDIQLSEAVRQAPLMDDWIGILEDFALNCLKVSADSEDHGLYKRIKKAVAKIGFGLSERGIRKVGSPVDRVLAFSASKAAAVGEILDLEYRNLEDRLRAAVITDFESMSATAVRSTGGVLDPESGGAVGVLRQLLSYPVSQFINPCLVTGSLVLVDKRIQGQFLAAAEEYLGERGHGFDLRTEESESFVRVLASSSRWDTRLYVAMATNLFERGITKCLVGTRGIFGEGWDSQSLNTLIDLTTSTAPVSVKQLRGRGIRLNVNDPLGAGKVANNWDVVCIAPELEKGLNDYSRFARKHDGYFGIADDGQIECGVGHVHPSFSDLSGAEVFVSTPEFNAEMMQRALAREKIYDLWGVGKPYANKRLGCIEVSRLRQLALTPPYIRWNLSYRQHVKQLRAALAGVWAEYGALGTVVSTLVSWLLAAGGLPIAISIVPFVFALLMAQRKFSCLYARLQKEVCQPNTQESSLSDIGQAVLSALVERRLLPSYIDRQSLRVAARSGNFYRVFLDKVEPEHSMRFVQAVGEVLSPIAGQDYLIPKYEYSTAASRFGADQESTFFRQYLKGRAEPRISAYYPVPKLLARSQIGRLAFQEAWNKYVSPGFVVSTESKPELLLRYFGMGPGLSQKLIWE